VAGPPAEVSLAIVDLGDRALRDRLDQFGSHATDRALAEALGQVLVPDAVFRTTHETFDTCARRPLYGPAVRRAGHHGQPLIARGRSSMRRGSPSFACARRAPDPPGYRAGGRRR